MTSEASFDPSRESQREARAASIPPPDTLTPADRYEELFVAVQRARVFADSKTFVDLAPRDAPAAILRAYRAEREAPGFDLAAFVATHFESEHVPTTGYESVAGQSLCAHIDALWPVLTRHPMTHSPRGSALRLPHPYVVPGGRFTELYYWDSYFTMLGLAVSGHAEQLGEMVDGFAYLIDTYGHVPNGTRTYYLSRSQPPVFALMVELAQAHGVAEPLEHLPQLIREHAYWMEGAAMLAPDAAHRRVVRLPNGALLNRYWDDRDTPREEAWLEDVSTAEASARDPRVVFRELRAAAESGWDFSTRWLRDAVPGHAPSPDAQLTAETARSLASICTTEIVPVDLNAFLFKLEKKIAELAGKAGDPHTARIFEDHAEARRTAVIEAMWDAEQGAFFDFDLRERRRRTCLTAASMVPLFTGLATQAQADATAETITRRLLVAGGVGTSEVPSDQQWDRPNGWAPLQWMAIRGFESYGHHALARTITDRWLTMVAGVFEREGKLVEKYLIRHGTDVGRGGEYPLQDGFGWTNGVTRALLAQRDDHEAHGARAHAQR